MAPSNDKKNYTMGAQALANPRTDPARASSISSALTHAICSPIGWTRSLKACITLGRVPLAVKAASVPSLAFPQEQSPLGILRLAGRQAAVKVIFSENVPCLP